VFDIPPDPLEFVIRPDQVIVTFILPKGPPGPPEQQVSPLGAASLQRSEKPRYVGFWGKEKMHVIGHNDPCMRLVVSSISAILDRVKDLLRYGWPPQETGPTPGLIQHAVHSDERSAGSHRLGRKRTLQRKSVVQSEGDE